MNIAYVRVSTAEQNEQRQVNALQVYHIERWFMEKVSGKDTNRPQLQAMLDFAREGDTIYVHDFSRLARSTSDLLRIVELLQHKKIHLVSNKESIDSSTPTGKLMLTMIGAINEFERQNILERQKEGIAIAKEKGARRCLPLKVSGPFHTPLMAPAGNALREYFQGVAFADPQIPVIFNCLGDVKDDSTPIQELLVKQVQSSVFMEDSIRKMADMGVDAIVEIGPGKALSGFVKKTVPGIPVCAVETAADVENLPDTLEQLIKEKA